MKKSDLFTGIIFSLGGFAITYIAYYKFEISFVMIGLLVSMVGSFGLGAYWWSKVENQKERNHADTNKD